MKKKVLMVLLAATLSVSMIAGCGSKGDNNTDTTKTESKQTVIRKQQIKLRS